jgi:hypothetical protein
MKDSFTTRREQASSRVSYTRLRACQADHHPDLPRARIPACNLALGGLANVRYCSAGTLADGNLSNLKTGRHENTSWIRISPLSRSKFSPSQETTLSFVAKFRALRTVDPARWSRIAHANRRQRHCSEPNGGSRCSPNFEHCFVRDVDLEDRGHHRLEVEEARIETVAV